LCIRTPKKIAHQFKNSGHLFLLECKNLENSATLSRLLFSIVFYIDGVHGMVQCDLKGAVWDDIKGLPWSVMPCPGYG